MPLDSSSPLVDIFWSFFAGNKSSSEGNSIGPAWGFGRIGSGLAGFSAGFSSFCASTNWRVSFSFEPCGAAGFSGTGEDTSPFVSALFAGSVLSCEASKGMEQTSGSLSGLYKIFKLGSSVMKGFSEKPLSGIFSSFASLRGRADFISDNFLHASP